MKTPSLLICIVWYIYIVVKTIDCHSAGKMLESKTDSEVELRLFVLCDTHNMPCIHKLQEVKTKPVIWNAIEFQNSSINRESILNELNL